MDDPVYGIDFGTTNSAIAYLKNGKPHVVRDRTTGRQMIRSALFFPNHDSQLIAGDAAIDKYIEYEMDGRLIQSVKTILPAATFTSTWIKNKEYDAENLIAIILKFLKKKADQETGIDVRRAIIGRPARFSPDPKIENLAVKRLKNAAKLAGFTDVVLQIEPVAAALSYEMNLTKPECVLVADFGGGTSDFTLMRLSPAKSDNKDRKKDVLGSRGLYIAGDVFDSEVMRKKFAEYFGENVRFQNIPGRWMPIPSNIYNDFCNKGRIIQLYNPGVRDQIKQILSTAEDQAPLRRLLELIDHNLGFPLFEAVENAKCELSENDEASIEFHLKNLDLSARLSRSEFDSMISHHLNALARCVNDLLMECALEPRDIDSVYLTGGSSLVPSLINTLGNIFGNDKLTTSEETFLSVVSGLALSSQGFQSI